MTYHVSNSFFDSEICTTNTMARHISYATGTTQFGYVNVQIEEFYLEHMFQINFWTSQKP